MSSPNVVVLANQLLNPSQGEIDLIRLLEGSPEDFPDIVEISSGDSQETVCQPLRPVSPVLSPSGGPKKRRMRANVKISEPVDIIDVSSGGSQGEPPRAASPILAPSGAGKKRGEKQRLNQHLERSVSPSGAGNPSPSILPPCPRLRIARGRVVPAEEPQPGPSTAPSPQPGPSRVTSSPAPPPHPSAQPGPSRATAKARREPQPRQGKSMGELEVLLRPLETSEDEEEQEDEGSLEELSQISGYDDDENLTEGCEFVLRTIEVCKRRNVAIVRELAVWYEEMENARRRFRLALNNVIKLKREKKFNKKVIRRLRLRSR